MTKFTCLFLLTFLNVSANGVAQNRLSLSFKDANIEKVFSYIEKKSDFVFYYNNDEVQQLPKVNISLSDVSVEQALNYLSQQALFKYNILDSKLIIIRKDGKTSTLQDRQTHGRVTDSSGNPLAGAVVNIKGTSKNTVTDVNGNFTIDAPDGAVLVINMIGYTAKEIEPNGRDGFNVQLIPVVSALNDVVITAFGITRQNRTVGYSTTAVSGAEFTQARETNVAWGLEGRVAGVNVTKPVTGAMGSSNVVIRGYGSLNGASQPLYVVDGVPIVNNQYGQVSVWYGGSDGGDGISSINPDDIETMTVLKGGTAAALYGSRASNGAIVITTKSGKSKDPRLNIDFNSTYAFDKPIWDPKGDLQWEYGQGTNGQKPQTQAEAFNNPIGQYSWGAKLDGSPVVQFDGVLRPYSAVKDNIQHFYSGSNTFTNNIALYGGTAALNARFSVTDMDNHDLMPNSGIRRDNFTLNVNSHIGNFTGRYNAMYITQNVQNPPYASDASWNGNTTLMVLPTNYDVRNLSEQIDPSTGKELLWNAQAYRTNPYFNAYQMSNISRKNRFITSADLKYDFTNAFYARVLMGEDYGMMDNTSHTPAASAITTQATMSLSKITDQKFEGQAMLGYNNTWTDWSLSAMAGGAMMRTRYSAAGMNGSGIIVPDFYAISNFSNRSPSYSLSQTQTNSLYGSAEIGFRRYLYLTVTGRNDWFSTLNGNGIFYPSVSLSYVLSDNIKLPSFLNYLKIRGAWAQTGGDNSISPYAQVLTYTANSNLFQGQVLGRLNTSTIPPIALSPAESKSYEAGFEARFLHSRLGVDFTFYNRKTINDIFSANVSETSGFSNTQINGGEVSNKGIELLITGTPIKTQNFGWDIAWNFAYNSSKVVSMVEGTNSFMVDQSRPGLYGDGGVPAYIMQIVGQRYDMIQGTTYVRNAQGSIVYDANGLPKVGPVGNLGTAIAPVGTGLTNSLHYKNFNLNFLVDAKFGGHITSGTNNMDWLYGLAKATLPGRETGVIGNGVNEQGQPNTVNVPAQTYYQFIANNIAEQFVYKSDFIKLRQVVFGYALPQKWWHNTIIRDISVSFVARNLWTLYSKVPIVDPESVFMTDNHQGIELWGLPATRSFGFNLNVKF